MNGLLVAPRFFLTPVCCGHATYGTIELVYRCPTCRRFYVRDTGSITWAPLTAEPPPDPIRESVLEEAQRLVGGDRNDAYGDPHQDFARVGRLWGAILDREAIDPATVGLMLIALKLAREAHIPKRDNLTDIAGYALCVEMCRAKDVTPP